MFNNKGTVGTGVVIFILGIIFAGVASYYFIANNGKSELGEAAEITLSENKALLEDGKKANLEVKRVTKQRDGVQEYDRALSLGKPIFVYFHSDS